MRLRAVCVGLVLAAGGTGLLVAAPRAAAVDEPLEAQLRSVMMKNVEGLREENIDKCLAAFHPDGPGRKAAETSMRRLFPVTDFQYEVSGFKVVGTDGDYAFARLQQQTKLVGEPKIPVSGKQSSMDMLMVYRKGKDGAWKIWMSAILSSEVK